MAKSIGRDGPSGEGRKRSNLRNGTSYIDPTINITEKSQRVKINGETCMGHYDINGKPVEGPIKINNLRIFDGEGNLVQKLQFVALTSDITKDKEWFYRKKALCVEEYIEQQEAARIKNGDGFVYDLSFFELK